MTDLYGTKITIEVFSKRSLEGLTLAEIAAQIDDDTFIAGTLIAESTHLTPMQMSGALLYEDIERDRLMGDEAKEDQPHGRFEYDELYSGGIYRGEPEMAYIPLGFCKSRTAHQAFADWTGLSPAYLVNDNPLHYSNSLHRWTSNGEPWQD